jgi:hypothetical protein
MQPAVTSFLLAPLMAEFLLGNLPIILLPALLRLAPLYGGGAPDVADHADSGLTGMRGFNGRRFLPAESLVCAQRGMGSRPRGWGGGAPSRSICW